MIANAGLVKVGKLPARKNEKNIPIMNVEIILIVVGVNGVSSIKIHQFAS